ncbi:hypothetical protein [Lentzea flava]|uniref:hypothetical protein n=1 Tax=Lentzea flava TaxID=103732 RepID=UPI001E5B0367|nr:hypothetical protein [Lentzea flava]
MTSRISGISWCVQCPAVISLCTTSRIWPAVTLAVSSPGASRTASSGAVHECRPLSRATTE